MGEKVLEELNVNLPAKLCNQSPEKKKCKEIGYKNSKTLLKALGIIRNYALTNTLILDSFYIS